LKLRLKANPDIGGIMKKRFLLLGVISVFFLSNCTKSGDALKYNNRIIDIQSKVIKKILSLSQSMKSRNPDLMRKRLGELQDQATASADELNNVPEFEGGEELFNAAMDLFEFYESVCKNEFAEMVDILARSGSGVTADDLSRMQDLQKVIQEEESRLDRELFTAQQNFAKQFNFRIGENQLQKKINNL
jgi:hypothetical protein